MAKNVDHTLAERPLRAATPAPHWKNLRPGQRVSVLLAPGFSTDGLVDALTADHTTVWVILDGGRGRTLLHCSDGVEILPHQG